MTDKTCPMCGSGTLREVEREDELTRRPLSRCRLRQRRVLECFEGCRITCEYESAELTPPSFDALCAARGANK